MGVPGRADRRPHLLPDHHAEPDPAALVGAVRDLEGRPGIWGGIACGVAAGLWVLYRRLDPYDVRRFMDAAAPGLLVAQAFGRVGNYFNQELFGGPTTLPWGLKIDLAHRPPHYTQYMTFHPTFLYEIIWNLLLAAFLVWLGHHRRIRPPGLFALYVAGYSGFRVFEETLRVDYSNHIFGLRLNFFVASILCILGLLWFVAIQREWKMPSWFPRRSPRPPAAGQAPARQAPASKPRSARAREVAGRGQPRRPGCAVAAPRRRTTARCWRRRTRSATPGAPSRLRSGRPRSPPTRWASQLIRIGTPAGRRRARVDLVQVAPVGAGVDLEHRAGRWPRPRSRARRRASTGARRSILRPERWPIASTSGFSMALMIRLVIVSESIRNEEWTLAITQSSSASTSSS